MATFTKRLSDFLLFCENKEKKLYVVLHTKERDWLPMLEDTSGWVSTVMQGQTHHLRYHILGSLPSSSSNPRLEHLILGLYMTPFALHITGYKFFKACKCLDTMVPYSWYMRTITRNYCKWSRPTDVTAFTTTE